MCLRIVDSGQGKGVGAVSLALDIGLDGVLEWRAADGGGNGVSAMVVVVGTVVFGRGPVTGEVVLLWVPLLSRVAGIPWLVPLVVVVVWVANWGDSWRSGCRLAVLEWIEP